jgi:hypothetical protein
VTAWFWPSTESGGGRSQATMRLLHPESVGYLWTVADAAVLGFLGDEGSQCSGSAWGHEIGSAALVAARCHARADGNHELVV